MLIASLLATSCQRPKSPPTVPSELLDKQDSQSDQSKPIVQKPDVPQNHTKETSPPLASKLPTLSPAQACTRFRSLTSDGCEWTKRFPPAVAQSGVCEQSLAQWKGHPDLEMTMNCWGLDCKAAETCMKKAVKLRKPQKKRACGDTGTTPIFVDAKTWANRRGANTKRFSEISTSVAKPIEVCKIMGELKWMTRVTCDDGSNPYQTVEVAHKSRDPWFSRGGRCNSVLDRYSVKCPEKTYVIHVDRYVCLRRP